VRGLLPAELPRRIPAAAAAAAAALLAVLAPGAFAPARAATGGQAAAGTVSVTIDSMSPQVATPRGTVTVTGTVSNGTGQAQAGLQVQLYTSPARFTGRDQMDAYLTQGGAGSLEEAAGNPFVIAASLAPGATVGWHASFSVAAAGMTQFGVYPLAAQLADDFTGSVLATDPTLLPFWPGSGQAAGLASPLRIAWVWPLIGQPRSQVCAALTNNGLAASLGPGGRLAALLAAGQQHPAADLTWLIDPALLGAAATMTRPYQVGITADCTAGTRPEPASKAAVRWLSALREVAASQPVVITPYANVDVTALVHQGLNADLAAAYRLGGAVAGSVLHQSFGHSIAVPAGGTADLSTLTDLAAAEQVSTVVLSSSEMPPLSSAVFEDDAVTSVRTAAGTTMTVLLADDTLTKVLAAGDTSSGTLPPGTEFAVKQRFLAETAMIAAEAPAAARTVVVAPPSGWSPTAALASDLLGETVTAPWLKPATLGSLTGTRDDARTIARRPPPASMPSPGELGRGYLSAVGGVGAALAAYKSMLYRPPASYLQALGEALAATESSAWRGGGQGQGLALADGLSDYLADADSKVKIIASPQVPMGGSSGAVPVSIENGLHQAIQVVLNAHVVAVPGSTSQLVVGRFPKTVTVLPQQPVTVKLPVSSAPIGSTVIKLTLTSADGRPLPVAGTSLTVQSTRYGRAILFLIGAALGVLVLTSGYRGVRRWLGHGGGPRPHRDGHAGHGGAAAPGSVVTGTSRARDPTEASDDLAEARRWVDGA
jgi:hypothetical protein